MQNQELRPALRIVCISDTHNKHAKVDVPDGDVLVHTGDATMNGGIKELAAFHNWMGELPHKHKLFVPGNHDRKHQKKPALTRALVHDSVTYLEDSGVEIEGWKFWGSPWQPEFCNWAYNLPRGKPLAEKWALIPDDTDILLTHGPPFGVLDKLRFGEMVGCEALTARLSQLNVRLHVFGHIHETAGTEQQGGCTYVNASTCTPGYVPDNPPIVVEWDHLEWERVASD